jgi:hypothetical protein
MTPSHIKFIVVGFDGSEEEGGTGDRGGFSGGAGGGAGGATPLKLGLGVVRGATLPWRRCSRGGGGATLGRQC